MAVIVTSLNGDRAAHDVIDYPERHASDLEANTPIHHVPAGTVVGQQLTWDGSKWVAGTPATAAVTTIITLGTMEGILQTGVDGKLKILNLYGQDRAFPQVYISLNTPSAGADIIVQLYHDGDPVFASGNRPTITAGNFAGFSTTFLIPAWLEFSYLTWDVVQVGTVTPGSDLVVHIVHVPG